MAVREVGVAPMARDPKQRGAVKTKVSPMAVEGGEGGGVIEGEKG